MNSTYPTRERRQPGSDADTPRTDEETLVADSRALLTPSQIVEQKLIRMLDSSTLMISQVQRRMKPGPR